MINLPEFRGEEDYLKWQLAELHRSYLTAAQPILTRLAAIESCKPPLPFILTVHLQPSSQQLAAAFLSELSSPSAPPPTSTFDANAARPDCA